MLCRAAFLRKGLIVQWGPAPGRQPPAPASSGNCSVKGDASSNMCPLINLSGLGVDEYKGLTLLQVASHSPCLFPTPDLESVISGEPWLLWLENSKMVIETDIRTPDGLVSTEALLLLDPQAGRARKEMSVY